MYKKTYPKEEERELPRAPVTGPSCKHTEGVRCSPVGRNCARCGHNPSVAKERLQAFCDAHDIPMPVM